MTKSEFIKTAARGDQLLKAVSNVFSKAQGVITPELRLGAINRMVPGGYDGGAYNAVDRLMKGTSMQGDHKGNLLTLLTGRSTSILDGEALASALQGAARNKLPSNNDVQEFTGSLPGLVARARPQAALNRINKLPTDTLLGALRQR